MLPMVVGVVLAAGIAAGIHARPASAATPNAAQAKGPPPTAASCVTKVGSASGITRGFAEYEALLIIRQVTGNWPVESDRIEKPAYRCRQDGMLWYCRAEARVCKR